VGFLERGVAAPSTSAMREHCKLSQWVQGRAPENLDFGTSEIMSELQFAPQTRNYSATPEAQSWKPGDFGSNPESWQH